MPPLLPRYRPEVRAEEDLAVDEAVSRANDKPLPGEGKAGGDRWRLRGIPVVGHGVGGTSPGTDPYVALDRLDERPA